MRLPVITIIISACATSTVWAQQSVNQIHELSDYRYQSDSGVYSAWTRGARQGQYNERTQSPQHEPPRISADLPGLQPIADNNPEAISNESSILGCIRDFCDSALDHLFPGRGFSGDLLEYDRQERELAQLEELREQRKQQEREEVRRLDAQRRSREERLRLPAIFD